jgi:hypothetical protein
MATAAAAEPKVRRMVLDAVGDLEQASSPAANNGDASGTPQSAGLSSLVRP